MRAIAYKINQWNIWLRSLFLFVMLLIVWAAWYFFLEKPLLESNQAILDKQTQLQALGKELNTLFQWRSSFIYKNQLQAVQIKQVFQTALSNVSGVTLANYVDNPSLQLPAGAAQFTDATAILKLSLLNVIQRSSATLDFSSEFNNFVNYLDALESSDQGVYFDSIDFNMNRYPKAKVTIKVFTLEGAQ